MPVSFNYTLIFLFINIEFLYCVDTLNFAGSLLPEQSIKIEENKK